MTRRLAVEAAGLRAPLTGVGRYTSHLLAALLDEEPDLNLDLLRLGRQGLDLSLLDRHRARLQVHSRPRINTNLHRVAIGFAGLPRLETLFPVVRRASALLWPNFVGHPNHLGVPEVAIIYDATFRTHPDDKPWWFNLGWGRLVQQTLDSGATCVTISASAAADIAENFRVRRPLEVLYPGTHAVAAATPSEPTPYFLVVGTSSARKNVEVVVRAHQSLPAEVRPRLVVVGGGHTIEARDVDVRGFLSDEELAGLMSGARALVAPSLAEGFDLPVIEALTAGVPVIASDIPVHREVLGDDWPLLFKPQDADVLATMLQSDLRPTAVADVHRFDWHASAERLAALLGF